MNKDNTENHETGKKYLRDKINKLQINSQRISEFCIKA